MGSAYLDTIEASWYSPIKLFTNPSGLPHRRSSYSARRRCNYGLWCRRGTIFWRRYQFRCKSDWLDLSDRAADVIPVIPAGYDVPDAVRIFHLCATVALIERSLDFRCLHAWQKYGRTSCRERVCQEV